MADRNGVRRRRAPTSKGSRPCDACRRRKTKCVVESGQQKCSICLLRQNACTFDDEPPGRYLHASVQARSDSTITQASPSPQDVLDLMHFSGQNGSPKTLMNCAAAQSDPVSRLRPDKFHGSDSRWMKSLGLSDSRFAELYGLGSDMEPILMRHRPYSPETNEYTLPTHSIRRVLEEDLGVDYPLTFHMACIAPRSHANSQADFQKVADERSSSFPSSHVDVDAIENCVRPHGETLLRLFWKMVHPSYPVLCRAAFMERYQNSYRSIDAALLGSVYLNAMNWWAFDSNLSNLPLPELASLRKLTLQAIQNSYHRPRLSSVEAALLLLQCKPEDPLNPDHTFAWGLTAQALAIGEACGLHLDATSWDVPAWERKLRKRLSWALYMQDVWTAMAHGRPTHIVEDDWVVSPLNEEDFRENEGGGIAVDGNHFTCMVSLTQILHTVLKKFYTIRSARNQDTVNLAGMAQPLFEALETWKLALPSALTMESLPPRQLCPTGNLHLAYYGVKINVLRRLVRSTALAPLCLDIPILSSIRQQAHETAHGAIQLVSSLRLEHLDAFWYFAAPYLFSVTGSFVTLLLVTSLAAPERDHWRETLSSYLWTLRVMSKSNEPMRYAVNRLEGAILRGLEHALVVSVDGTSPMAFEATPTQTFEADLNGFGLGMDGSYGLDVSSLGLDAFDFLTNTALG